MSTFDGDDEAETLRHDEPRGGEFERTDIDADEQLDGDVDADGATAIPRRNE